MLCTCSAGVGRTGTFICVDSILKRIESNGTVDVFNFIRQLRFKRERTVETEVSFIYYLYSKTSEQRAPEERPSSQQRLNWMEQIAFP